MSRPSPPVPVLFWLLACGPVAGPAGATVWHADPVISGSVQGAADLAAPGDTVLLAPGTYFEHVAVLGKHLVLLGEAGPASTILDGGSAGRILSLGNRGGTVTVAGLTFANGALAGLEASDGAAILARNSPLRIEDCAFLGNRLLTPGRGGAIFATFFGPTTGPGPVPIPASPGLDVNRCRFESNTAGDEGGAVYCDEVSSVFTDCDFTGNTAVLGGAVSLLGEAHAFRNCRFEGNQAALHAGALMSTGSLVLEDVLFRDNRADDFGGALRSVSGADLQMVRTWFVGNAALRGAGLDASRTPVTGHQVLFYGGVSTDAAAGVYLDGVVATFTRCTWLANQAPFGASMVARDSDLSVSGSLLGDDDPQASECLAGGTVTSACNAGAPSTGECVEIAARLTVAGCSSNPEFLCTLPEFDACGVVGHADATCPPGACATPVLPSTWGRLKTVYR